MPRAPKTVTRRDFLTAASALPLAATLPEAPVLAANAFPDALRKPEESFAPLPIPAWVYNVTRMTFLGSDAIPKAAAAGVQVAHTNLIWPYYPLRRDGGGLSPDDDKNMKKLVALCHNAGMKLCLGLPPFPNVALVKAHPEWRVHPDDSNAIVKIEPREDNLGTRVGCNLGPWGDYLIAICAELLADYKFDGYSFDGNYHPPLCFCPACKAAYKREKNRDIPSSVNLDEIPYREYLVWRGVKLEDHYRRLQKAIKGVNPDSALTSWTTNAGRYGHFLTSPRVMTTRTNLLWDLPMQEWWQDESNIGASVMPAFGAAYLRCTTNGRPCASEPYLMSRGNPYGSDSFPANERRTRCLHAVTNGNILAESYGWPNQEVSSDFQHIARCAPYMTRLDALPYAALHVGEQTRQFYAYKDIAERFLPHPLGVFRAAFEEHLPLALINDWDLDSRVLARYPVIILANAAALSDSQIAGVREYVKNGGGLVATGETSLCDELGRPRADFALADLFGVSYQGHPQAPLKRPDLDPNFAVAIDENYWRQRTGVATLTWDDRPALRDRRLNELVPTRSAIIRAPLTLVTEPKNPQEVAARMKPEGATTPPTPALILRPFGKGRVAYFAASADAALWSYAYPYQRRLFVRALEWAANASPPIAVKAPMCVQTTFFTQNRGERLVIHFLNGVNTAANHGLPAMEVPLREEVIPIHDIEATFPRNAPARLFIEPGHLPVKTRKEGGSVIATLPPLEIHFMLIGEYAPA